MTIFWLVTNLIRVTFFRVLLSFLTRSIVVGEHSSPFRSAAKGPLLFFNGPSEVFYACIGRWIMDYSKNYDHGDISEYTSRSIFFKELN